MARPATWQDDEGEEAAVPACSSGNGAGLTPAERLQRLRQEVDAFSAWTEARRRPAKPQVSKAIHADEKTKGAAAVETFPEAEEAARLKVAADEVMAAASEAATSSAAATSAGDGLLSKSVVWLPPTPGCTDDIAMARHMVGLHRAVASNARPARNAQASDDDPAFFYKLDASLSSDGGGWFNARNAENLEGLQQRVDFLRQRLGGNDSEASSRDSLGATISKFHKRLAVLQQACSESACEQLLASVQCIAAELNEAMQEANHFVKLEAEEHSLEELGIDLSDEDWGAKMMKLHSEALRFSRTPLRAVSARLSEVKQMLAAADDAHIQLQHFSEDLGSVEARTAWTRALLEETALATGQMQESLKQSHERMARNFASLNQKAGMLAAAKKS